MKNPEDKTIAYAVVSAVCTAVIVWIVALIGGLFLGAGMLGGGMLGSGALSSRGRSAVQYDRNSSMGKLQELAKQMEESNKKVDASTKAGDPNAAAAAAMAGLGTLLGGGKHVDPVELDQLKPLLPETVNGLPKTSSKADRSGVAGLMVTKAEATYSDGADTSITIELVDTGGMSGLMGLAGWAGVEGEQRGRGCLRADHTKRRPDDTRENVEDRRNK